VSKCEGGVVGCGMQVCVCVCVCGEGGGGGGAQKYTKRDACGELEAEIHRSIDTREIDRHQNSSNSHSSRKYT
jgi:hypothetical protein